MIKQFLCKIFDHKWYLVRHVTKGVVEKKCYRCGEYRAFGYGKSVIMNDELRKVHDKLITRDYFNG